MSVGWGLNLAIVAGFIMLLASGVAFFTVRPQRVSWDGKRAVEPDAPAMTPAGWCPDPEATKRLRYWDGNAWNDAGAIG